MTAGSFAALVVSGTLALAAIPGWVAYGRLELFWTDVAIVLVPAPLFLVAASVLNPATRIGWCDPQLFCSGLISGVLS